jgi:hypothetical protein
MRKNFYIKIQKDKILVYLMRKLFLSQFLLRSNCSLMSKKVYTFLYITKVLANYGFVAPSNKKFGF